MGSIPASLRPCTNFGDLTGTTSILARVAGAVVAVGSGSLWLTRSSESAQASAD
ncbi:hypothetical protein P6B95_34960 [Streptomyces atratus]|uniref:hypothetical protein n=1 Tax=Streptomyces atratus TaxID=1893 RepID=UPI001670257F|nr:hypothetical protein [Streptomyces atratus]WPW33788.1 hypothetical protein P6B95_34960 [Streptomyces atratus]GGT19637.1 hypothetical protein GCM10010207_18510 [Streptomyces atratus]